MGEVGNFGDLPGMRKWGEGGRKGHKGITEIGNFGDLTGMTEIGKVEFRIKEEEPKEGLLFVI